MTSIILLIYIVSRVNLVDDKKLYLHILNTLSTPSAFGSLQLICSLAFGIRASKHQHWLKNHDIVVALTSASGPFPD